MQDYIVSEGDSGNWHYRKYASGWADAFYLGDSTSYTTSSVSGNIYYQLFGSISFPFSFTDTPTTTASWLPASYSCHVTLDGVSKTGITNVWLNRGNSQTTTGRLCIVLGGWWK